MNQYLSDQQLARHGSSLRYPSPAPACDSSNTRHLHIITCLETGAGHVLHWSVQSEQRHVIVRLSLHVSSISDVESVGEVGVDGDLCSVVGSDGGGLHVLVIVLAQDDLDCDSREWISSPALRINLHTAEVNTVTSSQYIP